MCDERNYAFADRCECSRGGRGAEGHELCGEKGRGGGGGGGVREEWGRGRVKSDQ